MKPLIFTLCWNRKKYALMHFEQVLKYAGPRDSYYWIVLDNHSTDGLSEWLKEHEVDFDGVIFNDFNHGIAHARNQALSKREKGQDFIHLEADVDIQGSVNFVECLQAVKERVNGYLRAGMIGGEFAQWHDGWPQVDPGWFRDCPINLGDTLDTAEVNVEKYAPFAGGWIFSKKQDPPVHRGGVFRRSQPIIMWGWMAPGHVLDEIGYFCEASIATDQEFTYRVGKKFDNWSTRALVYNLEKFHSAGTQPVNIEGGGREQRRKRWRHLWENGMSQWVDRQIQSDNLYRPSIFDPLSLDKFEGEIRVAEESGTYEEWSRRNLRWMQKNCQEDGTYDIPIVS